MDNGGHNRHWAERRLGPRLIQCGLGRGLLPYQVVSSFIQPFGHNRHELKTGGGGSAPFRGSCNPWSYDYSSMLQPHLSHRSRRRQSCFPKVPPVIFMWLIEAPPPVIFVRVQASHISRGGGALKLSGLLIFKRIKLVASTKKSSTVAEMGDRAVPAVMSSS